MKFQLIVSELLLFKEEVVSFKSELLEKTKKTAMELVKVEEEYRLSKKELEQKRELVLQKKISEKKFSLYQAKNRFLNEKITYLKNLLSHFTNFSEFSGKINNLFEEGLDL